MYFPLDHTVFVIKHRRQSWIISLFQLSLYSQVSAVEDALGYIVLWHITRVELGVEPCLASTKAPFSRQGQGSSRRSKGRVTVILITADGFRTNAFHSTTLSNLSWNKYLLWVSNTVYYQHTNNFNSVAHFAFCVIYHCSHHYTFRWNYSTWRFS